MERASANIQSCGLGAILSTLSNETFSKLKAIDHKLTCLELRADLLEDKIDYFRLRTCCNAPFLFVLKSKSEGGYFTGTLEDRKQCLIQAASYCDWIELEGERDLLPEILDFIPPEKRVISWQGKMATSKELSHRFKSFSKTKARMYRLVVEAGSHAETLIPLQFLSDIRRKDILCYAAGAIGQWTQIVAPYLGTPMIFGHVVETEKIPAVFPCEQLIGHYDFPKLYPFKTIYGIAGNPVGRSKSPAMHNGAYRDLGMTALYLPFHIVDFEAFWECVVCSPLFKKMGFEWGGFTVVSPFKSFVIPFSEKVDTPIIQQAMAGNVLKKKAGKWIADTTDFYGLEMALAELNVSMRNLNVAIIGCGGAGRVMAAGLKAKLANVLLVNRSEDRAEKAGMLLNLPYVLLADFKPEGFDLIINATPLGKNKNELPFDPGGTKPEAIIVDLTYAKSMTTLVCKSLDLGRKVISGRKILWYQVMQQFKLLTGRDMPEQLALEMAGVDKESLFLHENIFNENTTDAVL